MHLLVVPLIFNIYSVVLSDLIDPVDVHLLDDYDELTRDTGGINAIVYKSVNKYQCIAEEVEDAVNIMYGSKSWLFPNQDVNLTLSYPTAEMRSRLEHFDDYIITGFIVDLFMDTTYSQGYINEGGIWQETISLSFISSNISMLGYHIWIYGIPKENAAFYRSYR